MDHPQDHVVTEICPASEGLDRDPAAVVNKTALGGVVLMPDTGGMQDPKLVQTWQNYADSQPNLWGLLKAEAHLKCSHPQGAFKYLEWMPGTGMQDPELYQPLKDSVDSLPIRLTGDRLYRVCETFKADVDLECGHPRGAFNNLKWMPDTGMQVPQLYYTLKDSVDSRPILLTGGRVYMVCETFKADVDLKCGHPRGAFNNLDVVLQKQWKGYIQEMKLLKSGANDSMLIQLTLVLVGEALGGALAHALSRSSEHSHIQSLVQAGIMIGAGFTVAGIGLRRFKRRLSDYVMKAGAMSTALAIIVSFAGLLPAGLAWPIGAATSILVATGLALV